MKNFYLTLFAFALTAISFGQTQNVIDDNCPGFTPDFNEEHILPAGGIQFTDASGLLTSTSLTYHWDFGQGETSEKQSPFMTFDNEADFLIKLEVTDNNGCKATIEKVITWSYNNQ
jgi:PKD repeat protein